MALPCVRRQARNAGLQLMLLIAAGAAVGQKKINCPDGEHIQIDIKQISIQYDASSFKGTLSSLSALSARLEVAPKKLQEAAAATQQWDEFLKGLAAGYNSCAISRQQYADGVGRIYPRLKEDGAQLEVIRKEIDAGRKADDKRLNQLTDRFYGNLRRFAQDSKEEVIIQRIEAVFASGVKDILQQTGQILDGVNGLDQRMARLETANQQSPLPTPGQVDSDLRKSLEDKADDALAAYNKGFPLLDQYRFAEAIPFLQQALGDVSHPVFYLALGRAYRELPDLSEAERILREGLKTAVGAEHEAELDALLGKVLKDKGDLDGAYQFAQLALRINVSTYGSDHPKVAVDDNNIGEILYSTGDLKQSLDYIQQALGIDEKVYGSENPQVAIDETDIGAILAQEKDMEGALLHEQRALSIFEKTYGYDHPRTAIANGNIGTILFEKGDPDGALPYMQRALKIFETDYGPDHPNVAMISNNIGQLLAKKGDLDGAMRDTQRALKIDENAYGPDNPNTARDDNNIGMILEQKGDLVSAMQYVQRALEILQSSYGADNPSTKTVANSFQRIKDAMKSKAH